MRVSKRDFLSKIIFVALLLAANFAKALSVEQYEFKQKGHVVRVATTVEQLLRDPEFLRENPEYKPIARKAIAAVKAALRHDEAKGIIEADYNRVLAAYNGVDYRSLSDSDPRKAKIIAAVNALNHEDDQLWKKAINEFSSNPKEQKLLSQLVGAADYHDVPMARVAEFGDGTVRKIDPASKWIPNLERHPMDDRKTMTQIARYLEKNNDKYKDIYEKFSAKNLFSQDQIKSQHAYLYAHAAKTERLAQSALEAEKPARMAIAAKMAGVATKVSTAVKIGGAVITPVAVGAKYLIDPKNSNPIKELLSPFPFLVSDMAECQTLGCTKYENECKQKKLDHDACIEDFFRKPISEQTQMRSGDDLDHILGKVTPQITDFRCEKAPGNALKLKFSTINLKNVEQQQELVVGSDSKIQSLKMSVQDFLGRPDDLLSFKNGEPEKLVLYQNPLKSTGNRATPQVMQSFDLKNKDWLNKNIYFWNFNSSAQREQILRTQEAYRLSRSLKSNLLECCNSLKCLQYYSHLNARKNHPRSETRKPETAR